MHFVNSFLHPTHLTFLSVCTAVCFATAGSAVQHAGVLHLENWMWCFSTAGIQIEQPFAVLPLDGFSCTIEENVLEQLQVRFEGGEPGCKERPMKHNRNASSTHRMMAQKSSTLCLTGAA